MINIKRDGLLFRIMSVYGFMDKHTCNTTVCDIVLHLFLGCFSLFGIVAVGTILTMAFLEPFALIIMYLITGYFKAGEYFFDKCDGSGLLPYSVVLYIGGAAILLTWFDFSIDKIKWKRRIEGVKKDKKPSVAMQIIRGCYTRVKQKTCVLVHIDD